MIDWFCSSFGDIRTAACDHESFINNFGYYRRRGSQLRVIFKEIGKSFILTFRSGIEFLVVAGQFRDTGFVSTRL